MIKFELKKALAERQETMSNVSKATGIAKNTLSLLSNGTSKGIQFDTLEKICNYLDATPDELIKIVSTGFTVNISKTPYITSDKRKLYLGTFETNEQGKYFIVTSFIDRGKSIIINTGFPEDDEVNFFAKSYEKYHTVVKTQYFFKSMSDDVHVELSKAVTECMFNTILESPDKFSRSLTLLKTTGVNTTTYGAIIFQIKKNDKGYFEAHNKKSSHSGDIKKDFLNS